MVAVRQRQYREGRTGTVFAGFRPCFRPWLSVSFLAVFGFFAIVLFWLVRSFPGFPAWFGGRVEFGFVRRGLYQIFWPCFGWPVFGRGSMASLC